MIVVVKTHNPARHLRQELLERCLHSAERAFGDAQRVLLINGAYDGSGPWLRQLARTNGFQVVERWGRPLGRPSSALAERASHDDAGVTPGDGALAAGDLAALLEEDVCVFSDDDMVWHPGAGDVLADVWSAAPPNLLLLAGLLEPDYHWARPTGTLDVAGHRLLLRPNAPGAAWTFRVSSWSKEDSSIATGPLVGLRLEGLRDLVSPAFGYDAKACRAIEENSAFLDAVAESAKCEGPPRRLIAQLDLAEHIGANFSTHGNEAPNDADPIDRAKWGLQ